MAREYRVLSWSPQHVLVEGPKQLLEDRESVETVPITDELLNHRDMIEAPLSSKDLCEKKVRPDMVKVVLKRVGK